MLRSDYDGALSAFNAAIQFNPKNDNAYGLRGMVFRDLGNEGKALADLEVAIHLAPNEHTYVHNRGFLMHSRAEFDRALADVEAAIRLDPNDDQPHQGRAWILATCPLPRIRNGPQAVVSATRACELTKWSNSLDLATLAAAFSETGDFGSAVKWQETATSYLDLRHADWETYRVLLESYKGKKPYHTVGTWQSLRIRQE